MNKKSIIAIIVIIIVIICIILLLSSLNLNSNGDEDQTLRNNDGSIVAGIQFKIPEGFEVNTFSNDSTNFIASNNRTIRIDHVNTSSYGDPIETLNISGISVYKFYLQNVEFGINDDNSVDETTSYRIVYEFEKEGKHFEVTMDKEIKNPDDIIKEILS